MPASLLQANEIQLLLASASGTNVDRTAGLFFTTPGNATITFGPALSTPTVTKASTTPYVRPQATFTGQAEYNRYVSAEYATTSGTSIQMSILQTAGYLGAVPANWTLLFPNLSGATGWLNTWAIANGTPFSWSIDAQGGAIPFLDAGVANGTTRSASASSSADITLRTQQSGSEAGLLQQRLMRALKGLNPR